MILYAFPVAPNPTRVRLYIAEKRATGVDMGIRESAVALPTGEQSSTEHLARNPFGRLPVLELDDGSYLLESLAIIEYLEELHPEPTMIGREPLERARVRELERVAEIGVQLPISRLVHATRSPLGLPPSPAIAEQSREALPPSLRYLDERLADGRSFVAGDHPTIADCTLCAALQFARFGKAEIDTAYRHLHAWDRRFRERPSAASVLSL